jgi:2-polyprenyl-3-methyl-5-hydroxy-6-metoxy-1,4-benzoquinol methylase
MPEHVMVNRDFTEGYYNANAEEYFRATVGIDMSSIYDRFISKLVPGACILDAGCGSGRDTLAFVKRGYSVSAFDSSVEMVRRASTYTGQQCRVMSFQQVQFHEEFDGIWSCAALLHVPKIEMNDVLERLFGALKLHGVAYFSFIEGEGERISSDGRLFNSYTAASIRTMLEMTGAARVLEIWKSESDSPISRPAPWLHMLIEKI